MPGPLIAPLFVKLQNTELHRQVMTFTGAPMDVTDVIFERTWGELEARTDVRKAIRDIAGITLPPNATDTDAEYRLPQVLTAIAVLAERVQVELVLSAAPGMKIACPPMARYCLKKKCPDPTKGDRKSNGKNCCKRMRATLDSTAPWAKALADFGDQQRTQLGLGVNAKTYIFVNPGTLEMMAISSD